MNFSHLLFVLFATLVHAAFPPGFAVCKGAPLFVDISDLTVSPLIGGEYLEVRVKGKMHQLTVGQGFF
jgi:hypothetical protein